MNEKFLVIAGNRDQYLNFMKKKSEELWKQGYTSISLSHFVYADVHSIRGNRNPSGWFVGTWYDRPDALQIVQLLISQTDQSIKQTVFMKQMNLLGRMGKL